MASLMDFLHFPFDKLQVVVVYPQSFYVYGLPLFPR